MLMVWAGGCAHRTAPTDTVGQYSIEDFADYLVPRVFPDTGDLMDRFGEPDGLWVVMALPPDGSTGTMYRLRDGSELEFIWRDADEQGNYIVEAVHTHRDGTIIKKYALRERKSAKAANKELKATDESAP